MGTLVTVAVEHPDVAEGKRRIGDAINEMHRIEQLMSIFMENSHISRLNRYGCCKDVDADTIEVIRGASDGFEVSDGSWDITVLPLLKLWADRADSGIVPTDTEIADALRLVDYRKVVIHGKNIRFDKAGMGITLAGIAKGYAVDKAMSVLTSSGIKHALVNAGGDIKAVGWKGNDRPWRVGIRNPKNKKRFAGVVELCDQAIATSGSDRRQFDDIIDAKLGRPVEQIVSSTVIADRAIDADVLSSCLFVLGKERGMKVMADLGIEALAITKEGEILRSERWRHES